MRIDMAIEFERYYYFLILIINMNLSGYFALVNDGRGIVGILL